MNLRWSQFLIIWDYIIQDFFHKFSSILKTLLVRHKYLYIYILMQLRSIFLDQILIPHKWVSHLEYMLLNFLKSFQNNGIMVQEYRCYLFQCMNNDSL